MLVRMRTTLAGPDHNCPAGQVIELSNSFAAVLIKAGSAEKVEASVSPKDAKAEPEAAALETPETAVKKPAKSRRR